jgi:outer membrane protein assembly factor BamE (lipoprotein component of BamABCDE complex)
MKRIITIILISIAITACASISSTKIRSEGSKITKEQAEEIKPGVTTKNTITGTFGNPTKTDSKADGTEIFIYTYIEKKTPTYFGEFIVNERQSRVTTITLEITIKDGLVLLYNFKKHEE